MIDNQLLFENYKIYVILKSPIKILQYNSCYQ